MKRLTIREIAKKANVSPTAVSFVLNGRPGVGKETSEKILQIIEQEDFTPTRSSRRLVLRRSFNIALMFREEFSPFIDIFYWEIARSILERCNAQGYSLMLTEVRVENGDSIIPDIIREKDVDGVICLYLLPDNIRSALKREGIPYIIVDTSDTREGDTLLYIDYQDAIDKAIDYLVQRGMGHIALLHSSYAKNFYQTVLEGYRRSMSSRGLEPDERLLQTNCDSIESSYAAMETILATRAPLDAVLCSSIRFAVGAVKCIHHAGLSIPEDISLMSIDDNYLSTCVEPELTTIPVDTAEMGKRAFDMVIQMIKGEEVQSAVMPTGSIRVRRSVR